MPPDTGTGSPHIVTPLLKPLLFTCPIDSLSAIGYFLNIAVSIRTIDLMGKGIRF